MSEDYDLRAARAVLRHLDASDQDAAVDIEAYLGLGDFWNGPGPEPALPAASAADDVPDSLSWAHALLSLIRSLPPVQAAFIGVIEVSPPWWDAPETMPIGKIANMLEIAEDGELYRDEQHDWGWFPHHQPPE